MTTGSLSAAATRRTGEDRLRSAYSTVVVVTSAGSEQGRAVARVLAARGAELVLVDVDEAALEETHWAVRRDYPDAQVTMRLLQPGEADCDQRRREP